MEDKKREQAWKEFSETGLLWWVNRILHTFGWAIVFEHDGDELIDVFPMKVDYEGFGREAEERGYRRMKENFIKTNNQGKL